MHSAPDATLPTSVAVVSAGETETAPSKQCRRKHHRRHHRHHRHRSRNQSVSSGAPVVYISSRTLLRLLHHIEHHGPAYCREALRDVRKSFVASEADLRAIRRVRRQISAAVSAFLSSVASLPEDRHIPVEYVEPLTASLDQILSSGGISDRSASLSRRAVRVVCSSKYACKVMRRKHARAMIAAAASEEETVETYRARLESLVSSGSKDVRRAYRSLRSFASERSAEESVPAVTVSLCRSIQRSVRHYVRCHVPESGEIDKRAVRSLATAICRKLTRAGFDDDYMEYVARLIYAMVYDGRISRSTVSLCKTLDGADDTNGERDPEREHFKAAADSVRILRKKKNSDTCEAGEEVKPSDVSQAIEDAVMSEIRSQGERRASSASLKSMSEHSRKKNSPRASLRNSQLVELHTSPVASADGGALEKEQELEEELKRSDSAEEESINDDDESNLSIQTHLSEWARVEDNEWSDRDVPRYGTDRRRRIRPRDRSGLRGRSARRRRGFSARFGDLVNSIRSDRVENDSAFGSGLQRRSKQSIHSVVRSTGESRKTASITLPRQSSRRTGEP